MAGRCFVRACARKEEGAECVGEVKEKGDGGRGDVSCARAHGRKKGRRVWEIKRKKGGWWRGGGRNEGGRGEGRVGGGGFGFGGDVDVH